MGEEDQNSKFHWAGSQFPIFPPRLPSLDSKQPQIQKREPGVDRESPRTIPPILAGDVGKGILNTINTGGNSVFCFIFFPFILSYFRPQASLKWHKQLQQQKPEDAWNWWRGLFLYDQEEGEFQENGWTPTAFFYPCLPTAWPQTNSSDSNYNSN